MSNKVSPSSFKCLKNQSLELPFKTVLFVFKSRRPSLVTLKTSNFDMCTTSSLLPSRVWLKLVHILRYIKISFFRHKRLTKIGLFLTMNPFFYFQTPEADFNWSISLDISILLFSNTRGWLKWVYFITLINAGRGAIIILCLKIAIALEPNIRFTSNLAVNSSLSVVLIPI